MDPATLDSTDGAGAAGAGGDGDGVDSHTHPDGFWSKAPHPPQLVKDKNGQWPCGLCNNFCGKTPQALAQTTQTRRPAKRKTTRVAAPAPTGVTLTTRTVALVAAAAATTIAPAVDQLPAR